MVYSAFRRAKLWAGFFSKISYSRDVPLVVASFRHRRNYALPDDVWDKIDRAGGFLSRKEAGLLYWAAQTCPASGSVLELGSYEGRSTGVFALAGRQVHAIDAWSLEVSDLSAYGQGDVPANDVFRRFRSNLTQMQVESSVSVHRGLTHEIARTWTEAGAILFVDAGHTYEDVRGDLALWTPHLHPQGYMLMHDVLGDTYLGVTRAASELLKSGWRVIASSGSAVAFTRK
jgi:predicted O-methyltransferase YrrM